MTHIAEYLKTFLDKDGPVNNPLPVRKTWERVKDEITVHTRALKPVKLIEKYRPNETKDLKEYCLANFQPITQDGIEKGIDRLYRILSKSNFSIKVSDNISEYLQQKKFTLQDNIGVEESMDFENFILLTVTRLMIEDPNGVLLWFPVNSEDPKEIPLESPQNEKIEVEPWIVDSDRIITLTEEIFAFQARKKWKFKDGKTVKKEPYYFVVTKEWIWRYIPVRVEKGVVIYQQAKYYGLGSDDPAKKWFLLPSILLGGEKTYTRAGFSYQQSFFNSYVPWANEAIKAFYDNSAARVQCNFPVQEIKGDICTTCQGTGQIKNPSWKAGGNLSAWIKCSNKKCVEGVVGALSPNSKFIRKPPASGDKTEYALSPAVEFHSPDTAILESSWKAWESFIEKAESSINIIQILQAQSAVAKEVDRDQLFDMLIKISNNIFRIVKDSLTIIEAYREPFVKDRQKSVVTLPNDFTIKSQFDLMTELAEMKAKKVPSVFIIETARNLAKKVYNSDPEKEAMIDFISKWDILFPYDDQEIAQFKAQQGIDREDVIRHSQAYSILCEIMESNDLLKMNFDQIKVKADEKLAPFLAEETPLVNDNGES